MGVAVAIDFVAEILVVGDQNSLFIKRPLNPFFVVRTTMLVKSGNDIVTLVSQPACDAWSRAFIHHESHRPNPLSLQTGSAISGMNAVLSREAFANSKHA